MEKKEEQKVVSTTSYFEDKDKVVTRGELLEVLTQVMANVDEELRNSFLQVAKTAGLLDLIIKELDKRKVLSIESLQKTISDNAKEGQANEQ